MANLQKLDDIIVELESHTSNIKSVKEILEEIAELHEALGETELRSVKSLEKIEDLFPEVDKIIEVHKSFNQKQTEYAQDTFEKIKTLHVQVEESIKKLSAENSRAYLDLREYLTLEYAHLLDQVKVSLLKSSDTTRQQITLFQDSIFNQMEKNNESMGVKIDKLQLKTLSEIEKVETSLDTIKSEIHGNFIKQNKSHLFQMGFILGNLAITVIVFVYLMMR